MTKTEFIQYSDTEIVEELWESCIFPELMSHKDFVRHYQARHIEKYGKPLKVTKKHFTSIDKGFFALLSYIPFGA